MLHAFPKLFFALPLVAIASQTVSVTDNLSLIKMQGQIKQNVFKWFPESYVLFCLKNIYFFVIFRYIVVKLFRIISILK